MASKDMYPDLSGINIATSNPHNALLELCQNDPVLIQDRYETHRQTRNIQQRTRMLSPDFQRLDIDQILHKLVYKADYPGYTDPRNCLVFWARPTRAIKDLIIEIQDELRTIAPSYVYLWYMPADNLHMTALEITHSLTEEEIDSRVEKLRPKLEEITDYTFNHRTRLLRPCVSFDASAIALSFVPATDDKYTYHHLRRDLYELCSSTGVTVESRYVVPSAHLTIGRFIDYRDFGDGANEVVDKEGIETWLAKLEDINQWLKKDYWDTGKPGSEWIVGQEKGLDCNKGTLWYGNGDRVRIGKGF